MRHRHNSKRLGRKPNQAASLLKNIVTSTILYEHVRTTKKRAQVARSLVDQVITLGKKLRTDLAIRRINKLVCDENACRKILEVLKVRYAKRAGGFTRMVPVGQRQGDGALMVDIILIDAAEPVVTEEKKMAAPKKVSTSAKATADKPSKK